MLNTLKSLLDDFSLRAEPRSSGFVNLTDALDWEPVERLPIIYSRPVSRGTGHARPPCRGLAGPGKDAVQRTALRLEPKHGLSWPTGPKAICPGPSGRISEPC